MCLPAPQSHVNFSFLALDGMLRTFLGSAPISKSFGHIILRPRLYHTIMDSGLSTKRVNPNSDGDEQSKRPRLDEPGASSSRQKAATTDKVKNGGKRSRRRGRSPAEQEAADAQPKAPRLPKRQTAILLGFCGSRYRGMQ